MPARLAKKGFGAVSGFATAHVVAAEDDPPNGRFGSFGKQPEQRAAAADFDVVSMGADT
jgi:hypothetical protein